MQQQEQHKPSAQKKSSGYNIFTHIVDKCIYNFFAGLFLAVPLALIIILNLARFDMHGTIPLLLFLVIIFSFGYAFFGIGYGCGQTKDEFYTVTIFSALSATLFSCLTFVFPLLFIQTVVRLVMDIVPGYNNIFIQYMPHPNLSHTILTSTFCSGQQVCFFDSGLGKVLNHLLDILILGIGLSVLFFIVNSIVAIITVSSNKSKA